MGSAKMSHKGPRGTIDFWRFVHGWKAKKEHTTSLLHFDISYTLVRCLVQKTKDMTFWCVKMKPSPTLLRRKIWSKNEMHILFYFGRHWVSIQRSSDGMSRSNRPPSNRLLNRNHHLLVCPLLILVSEVTHTKRAQFCRAGFKLKHNNKLSKTK